MNSQTLKTLDFFEWAGMVEFWFVAQYRKDSGVASDNVSSVMGSEFCLKGNS